MGDQKRQHLVNIKSIQRLDSIETYNRLNLIIFYGILLVFKFDSIAMYL